MHTTIDTIVFDVGKVLVAFQWEELLHRMGYRGKTFEILADAIFRSPRWDERDLGLLDDDKYLRLFIENAPDYESDIRKVLERSGETICCFPYTQALLTQLKESGYKLYILSNYSSHLLRASDKELAFRKLMDGEIFSCHVHHMKPEPEIYQDLFAKYDITPQNAVFLDDRPENIEAARALGMHGIIFRDIRQALEELSQLGIHIG